MTEITPQQCEQALARTAKRIADLDGELDRARQKAQQCEAELATLRSQYATQQTLLPTLQKADKAETRAKQLDKDLTEARMQIPTPEQETTPGEE